jgi:HEAT repeat protein
MVVCGAAAALLGAGPAKGKGKGVPDLRKEPPPKAEETVRDLAFLRTNNSTRVEGVGLVIGLDGTGANPEPSQWRTKLVDRMRKAGLSNAEKWLESGTTSLVLVEGTIPPGVTTKDRWDIDLKLTPASTTKSLAGGYLLMTPLTIVGMVNGQTLDGQHMADAYGPVLVGTADDPKNLRTGRVLAGAHVKKDVPYMLVLKDDRKGFRSADLLQRVVNLRFNQRKGVEQVGMAVAKNPELIVLSVPRVYHENQYRYFQVIERLQVVETPELRAKRQERWAKELLDPKTAGEAALKLEGIGRNTIDTLKTGLASESPEVRFFAAEALAYLHDPAGVDVLSRAAEEMPEFRVFALVALAAMDEPAAALRLRELMNRPDPGLRYGAFAALRALDDRDPFLGRVRILHDEPAVDPEEEGSDAMAMRVYASPRRRKPAPEDPFELYLVESDGPPMIHVARSRRCEVVVFGRDQKLLTPAVLGGTGPFLVNASADDKQIEISRIGDDEEDRRQVVSGALGEVIVSLANQGATYPDVLAILEAASRQKNLEGPLILDALPPPLAGYEKAQLAGRSEPKADDAVNRAGYRPDSSRPGLLDRLRLWRQKR